MRLKGNFEMDVKGKDWLYIIAAAAAVILLVHGDVETAIRLIKKLLEK